MARKKATKPPKRKYSLSFTQAERDAIVNHSHLIGLARNRIKAAEGEAATLEFTGKQADELLRALQQPAIGVFREPRGFTTARERLIEALDVKLPERLPPAANDPALIYQFRVELLGTKPAVWRSIQVHDCTLDTLHYYLQAAFGWENAHLHQFIIGRVPYGPMHDDLGFDLEYEDEAAVSISQFRPAAGDPPWLYIYDFGDEWHHQIEFEGSPPPDSKQQYPVCSDGARSCPPEDCGGVGGYDEILEALSNPESEWAKSRREWCGEFDPNEFDTAKATKAMRKFG